MVSFFETTVKGRFEILIIDINGINFLILERLSLLKLFDMLYNIHHVRDFIVYNVIHDNLSVRIMFTRRK